MDGSYLAEVEKLSPRIRSGASKYCIERDITRNVKIPLQNIILRKNCQRMSDNTAIIDNRTVFNSLSKQKLIFESVYLQKHEKTATV